MTKVEKKPPKIQKGLRYVKTNIEFKTATTYPNTLTNIFVNV